MIWNPFNSEPKNKSVYNNITQGLSPEDKKILNKGLRRAYMAIATSPDIWVEHGIGIIRRNLMKESVNTTSSAPESILSKGITRVKERAKRKEALSGVSYLDRLRSMLPSDSPTPVDKAIKNYNDAKRMKQTEQSIKKTTEVKAITETMQRFEIEKTENKAVDIQKSLAKRVITGNGPVISAIKKSLGKGRRSQ